MSELGEGPMIHPQLRLITRTLFKKLHAYIYIAWQAAMQLSLYLKRDVHKS